MYWVEDWGKRWHQWIGESVIKKKKVQKIQAFISWVKAANKVQASVTDRHELLKRRIRFLDHLYSDVTASKHIFPDVPPPGRKKSLWDGLTGNISQHSPAGLSLNILIGTKTCQILGGFFSWRLVIRYFLLNSSTLPSYTGLLLLFFWIILIKCQCPLHKGNVNWETVLLSFCFCFCFVFSWGGGSNWKIELHQRVSVDLPFFYLFLLFSHF